MLQVALYARTSSLTNATRSGPLRQRQAAQHLSEHEKGQIAKRLSEVVSGSLPLDKRTAVVNFLGECRDAGINKVYVESSRVVARDASVAEGFYKLSKNLGVTIVPADVPALYDYCPNRHR